MCMVASPAVIVLFVPVVIGFYMLQRYFRYVSRDVKVWVLVH